MLGQRDGRTNDLDLVRARRPPLVVKISETTTIHTGMSVETIEEVQPAETILANALSPLDLAIDEVQGTHTLHLLESIMLVETGRHYGQALLTRMLRQFRSTPPL